MLKVYFIMLSFLTISVHSINSRLTSAAFLGQWYILSCCLFGQLLPSLSNQDYLLPLSGQGVLYLAVFLDNFCPVYQIKIIFSRFQDKVYFILLSFWTTSVQSIKSRLSSPAFKTRYTLSCCLFGQLLSSLSNQDYLLQLSGQGVLYLAVFLDNFCPFYQLKINFCSLPFHSVSCCLFGKLLPCLPRYS